MAAQAKQCLRFMKETQDGIRALKKEGYGTIRIASSCTSSKFKLSEILFSIAGFTQTCVLRSKISAAIS